MRKFKIRCSAIAELMAGHVGLTAKQEETLLELMAKPKRTAKQEETLLELMAKKSSVELPATAKSYVEKWFVQDRYDIRFEFKSKYTDKGNQMEQTALERYAGEFATRNDEFYEDDYFKGTPDFIIPNTLVADIKCPYSPETFPWFDPEPHRGYWMQLQGYMHLTNLKQAELVYCLEDTPPRGDWDEWTRYDMIPDSDRIRVYQFAYDSDFIESVIKRVQMARLYVEELERRFLK